MLYTTSTPVFVQLVYKVKLDFVLEQLASASVGGYGEDVWSELVEEAKTNLMKITVSMITVLSSLCQASGQVAWTPKFVNAISPEWGRNWRLKGSTGSCQHFIYLFFLIWCQFTVTEYSYNYSRGNNYYLIPCWVCAFAKKILHKSFTLIFMSLSEIRIWFPTAQPEFWFPVSVSWFQIHLCV